VEPLISHPDVTTAYRAETQRMLEERLAYHEAKAREEEARREAERDKT
jgi:hypothetical protein